MQVRSSTGLYKFEFFWNVAEPTTAIRMKIDPYCQQRNCSPLNVLFTDVLLTFQWCIDYADTAARSSAVGRQTRVGCDRDQRITAKPGHHFGSP